MFLKLLNVIISARRENTKYHLSLTIQKATKRTLIIMSGINDKPKKEKKTNRSGLTCVDKPESKSKPIKRPFTTRLSMVKNFPTFIFFRVVQKVAFFLQPINYRNPIVLFSLK